MPELTTVLVAIGSNIAPEDNVPAAIRAIDRHPGLELLGVSQVYESAAVGQPDQPRFHNAAVKIRTLLDPTAVREVLRGIEAKLGRVRTSDKYAPRQIDLDIAFFGDEEFELAGNEIPDPDTAIEAYLAAPLADVDPQRIDPITGLRLVELKENLMREGPAKVEPITPNITRLDPESRHAADIDGALEGTYAPKYEELVEEMLHELGEDPKREGLVKTPLRVAKAMDFLTSGYSTSLEEVVNDAIFEEDYDEMVIVKDIEFYSLCEHHMLPFFGKAAVGYLPNGRIIGVSKIARIVDLYARRLQVQERLANQVADGLMEVLQPHGVAVVLEASHFCMMMRGVQKQGSSMVSSAMRGTFTDNARSRSEFLELVAN